MQSYVHGLVVRDSNIGQFAKKIKTIQNTRYSVGDFLKLCDF